MYFWDVGLLSFLPSRLDPMPTSNLLQFLPLVIDSLAFGIYSTLFIQCLQLLYRNRRAHYKLYLGVMCALYFLSTVHIVLAFTWASITDTADSGIYEVFTLKQPLPVLFRPGDPPVVHALATLLKIRWVVANGVADAVVIHRCYVIWGSDWRAVALPLVSYACTMIGGFLDVLPLPPAAARGALTVGYGGVFLTNVLSSTLAAGRIWFMSRSFARLMGTKRRKRYMELIAIILESGLIYPFLLIITIVMFLSPAPTVGVLVCIALAYHLVGIAPTLIIVRVSLGVAAYMNRVDYFGILALGTVNYFPTFHYAFFCHPRLRNLYIALMTISGSTGIYLACSPTYASPEYRRMRTYTFFACGGVVLLPFVHAIWQQGLQEANKAISFRWILLEAAFYVGGALLYSERFPECRWPGRSIIQKTAVTFRRDRPIRGRRASRQLGSSVVLRFLTLCTSLALPTLFVGSVDS
ncbi:Ras-GEF domain-containing protein [Mycena chlorophos]|uniref:Ras-GEF domain-containing protein n=1 Tax=Mycena chlorophos TaxID=658473 RepID=A0A8H6TC46_MYCCL|nr:Ras-GEF domain-containing protein [Mycena chlorophos]